MLKEYDRLKIEYDAQLAKIQLRMKENLDKKKLEVTFYNLIFYLLCIFLCVCVCVFVFFFFLA